MKDVEDFLAVFMGGNSTRARILRVFILDPERGHLLTDVARRAGTTVATARKEAKALERWNVLKKGRALSIILKNGHTAAKKKSQKLETWGINPAFKHLRALTAFVEDVSPMQFEQITAALRPAGKITAIIVSGTFMGDPSRPADILVAADTLNERRLESAVRSLEPVFGREIRYAAFTTPELRYRLTIQDRLIRETLDFPHLVLLDRARLF